MYEITSFCNILAPGRPSTVVYDGSAEPETGTDGKRNVALSVWG